MICRKILYTICLTASILLVPAQTTKDGTVVPIGEGVEFWDLGLASAKPETVTSLKLRRQGLKEIPDLSKFVNLRELDLSDNELVDFTGKLKSLTRLEVLNLSGNDLTKIPDDVCSLKALKSLNLSSNQIAGGSLACMTGLERLYLNNNSLTAVPAGVTEIESLKSVYLHSNQLTVLPEKFAKMPNLEALLVQFNKIAEEPNVFRVTGIVNYVFEPQAINPRLLYKYFYMRPAYVYSATSVYDQQQTGQKNELPELKEKKRRVKLTRQEKWERIGAYYSVGVSYGWAYHNAIRKDHLRKQELLVRGFGGRANFTGLIEVGLKNFAGGIYFTESAVQYYAYNDNGSFDEIRTHVVQKIGGYYKQFFAPLSSRMRPYIRLGVGGNNEDNSDGAGNYYGPINLQARAGVDLYFTRFSALTFETGFGAGNYLSGGLSLRIPFRKRAAVVKES